jgi:hypothetical protein
MTKKKDNGVGVLSFYFKKNDEERRTRLKQDTSVSLFLKKIRHI